LAIENLIFDEIFLFLYEGAVKKLNLLREKFGALPKISLASLLENRVFSSSHMRYFTDI